jgi:hypothetical protein
MASYIKSAQDNINKIVEGIVAAEKADVRFALIKYRDHPPQDKTFVTEIKPFTSSVSTMRSNVNTMSASGGGDGPEAVADAMHDALKLEYRAGAAKVIVIIADAPPHGIEPTGDGFPNGSPNGHDPIKIAKEMSEKDIAVYCVLCEPEINNYQYARDFFIAVAKITGGEYLPLTSAHLLPKVVIGGAAELISLQRLQNDVEMKAAEEQSKALAAGEKINEGDLVMKMEKLLKEEKKAVTNQITMNDFYSPSYEMDNCERLEHAKDLSEVKGSLKPHTKSAYTNADAVSAPQSCSMAKSSVSRHQVEKMTKKCMHKNNYY